MPQDNSLFAPIFAVVAVLVAVVFVFVIVTAVLNTRKVRKHGLDPLTLQADLAAKVMQSDLLAPSTAGQSKAQRLVEVDALLETGAISADEHSVARSEILRD